MYKIRPLFNQITMATLAPVLRLPDDGPLPPLPSSSALLRALAPPAPLSQLAVDHAHLRVALLRLLQRFAARDSPALRSDNNLPASHAPAPAASDVTTGKLAPLRHAAVDRAADFLVARFRLATRPLARIAAATLGPSERPVPVCVIES